MRNCIKSDEGQATVLFALSLVMLLGFMGMAVEVGLMYRTRENTQIAADAAAKAAALDYLYNGSPSSAQAIGKAASSANGYTDGTGGVTVTINVPPKSGPATTGNYAEAIVTGPFNLLFFRGFLAMTGSKLTSINVSSRAVAGEPNPGSTCIWLLASTGTGLRLQGAYDIEAPNCGIYVNSSSSSAVSVTGNGGTMNVQYLDAVGNSVPKHQTSPTPVTPNTAPRNNPWSNLTGPTVPGSCNITSSATSITSSNVAQVSGSAVNDVVCFTNSVTLSDVNLPGASSGVVYVFENGVSVSGTVTLGTGTYDSGTGQFINTSGAVMEIQQGTLSQGNATLNIYAPTSGTYNGIAILQPITNPNELQVQFGSGNQVLDGYIFAPGAEVYLQDNGGGITATGIVADSMFDKASTINIPSYDQANKLSTPNRDVILVE